jgi:chaperone modulatory protein CbpM
MKPETQTHGPLAPAGGKSERSHPEVTLLSIGQTAQLSGVSEADLLGLVEYGVLTPGTPDDGPRTFDVGCVMRLQRAAMMREDLALDSHGFALALMFLNQITGLEDRLYSSQCDLRDCCNSGSACAKAMQ